MVNFLKNLRKYEWTLALFVLLVLSFSIENTAFSSGISELEDCTQRITQIVQMGDEQALQNEVLNIPNYLRIKIARNLLKTQRLDLAKLILENHSIDPGTDQKLYLETEWFIGFLDLIFCNDAPSAILRFQKLINCPQTAVSRSKVAFWLGFAFLEQKNTIQGDYWLNIASRFSTTFYGQIAQFLILQHLGLKPQRIVHPVLFDDPVPFAQQPIVNHMVIELLQEITSKNENLKWSKTNGLTEKKFLDCYLSTPLYLERMALLKAAYLFHSRAAVLLYKKIFHDYGISSFLGYPLLEQMIPSALLKNIQHVIHNSSIDHIFLTTLAHAIIRQETEFNPHAKSPAGAKGLMQLMDPVAVSEFEKIIQKNSFPANLAFEPSSLIDNIILGMSFLKTLEEKFGSNILLIAASYNAGQGNVNKWIKTFGDPRSEGVNTLAWIELIPFPETRHYVQSVIESFIVYSYLLNSEYLQDIVWSLF